MSAGERPSADRCTAKVCVHHVAMTEPCGKCRELLAIWLAS